MRWRCSTGAGVEFDSGQIVSLDGVGNTYSTEGGSWSLTQYGQGPSPNTWHTLLLARESGKLSVTVDGLAPFGPIAMPDNVSFIRLRPWRNQIWIKELSLAIIPKSGSRAFSPEPTDATLLDLSCTVSRRGACALSGLHFDPDLACSAGALLWHASHPSPLVAMQDGCGLCAMAMAPAGVIEMGKLKPFWTARLLDGTELQVALDGCSTVAAARTFLAKHLHMPGAGPRLARRLEVGEEQQQSGSSSKPLADGETIAQGWVLEALVELGVRVTLGNSRSPIVSARVEVAAAIEGSVEHTDDQGRCCVFLLPGEHEVVIVDQAFGEVGEARRSLRLGESLTHSLHVSSPVFLHVYIVELAKGFEVFACGHRSLIPKNGMPVEGEALVRVPVAGTGTDDKALGSEVALELNPLSEGRAATVVATLRLPVEECGQDDETQPRPAAKIDLRLRRQRHEWCPIAPSPLDEVQAWQHWLSSPVLVGTLAPEAAKPPPAPEPPAAQPAPVQPDAVEPAKAEPDDKEPAKAPMTVSVKPAKAKPYGRSYNDRASTLWKETEDPRGTTSPEASYLRWVLLRVGCRHEHALASALAKDVIRSNVDKAISRAS